MTQKPTTARILVTRVPILAHPDKTVKLLLFTGRIRQYFPQNEELFP